MKEETMGWNGWLRLLVFVVCMGMASSVLVVGCQGSSGVKDAGNQGDKSLPQDTASGKDTGSSLDVGQSLPPNAKCDPNDDRCESGTKCCATCCGTPPPPDAGPRDPNYRCVTPGQNGECQAVP